MKKMKALVKKYAKSGIWMDEVPVPEYGPNDVLIKIHKNAYLKKSQELHMEARLKEQHALLYTLY